MEGISAAGAPSSGGARPVALKRTIGLPLAVLYGLGVTIGAGIYVLIGAAAGRAGMFSPMAFVIAALVMGLTACAFAELVGRLPVSAGEAAYVRDGFRSERLALIVGLLVIVAAVVAAAAIANGSAGYIRTFVDVPQPLLAALVLVVMGLVAAIGMLTSAWVAAVMTVIEIGGLVAVIVFGFAAKPHILLDLSAAVPPLRDAAAWSGIFAATMLAFFAFIGFEGLVNIAEEVKAPERTLPRAIFITLLLSTLLYILVAWVALTAVPHADLARHHAPLAFVFERVTGAPAHIVAAIAIVATLNGIIAQIVLASRVMYGLAEAGDLPPVFGAVAPVTGTPLVATGLATAVAIMLATMFPIDRLADWVTVVMLAIFCLVNAALVRIKWRGTPAPGGIFVAPLWVPVLGAVTCAAGLVAAFVR